MKNPILAVFVTIALLFSSTSCMMTKTDVGDFREVRGEIPYNYSKGRQLWLFWGLIPLGRTKVNTPGHGNCQVVTKFNFGDVLISGLTGGILFSYSIKVRVKKGSGDQ